MLGNNNFHKDKYNHDWMELDIRNLRTKYINIEKDTRKSEQMISLLDEHGFSNYERFNALTSPENSHAVLDKENELYGTHMCGLSHMKLLKETILKDGEPILILEDDVDIENIEYEIHIPKNADCIYFGISHGDGNYVAENIGYPRTGKDFLKVGKIFTTHAILHINPRYSAAACAITEFCILTGMPFDSHGLAYQLQSHFNVYSPKQPFFYQSESKQNNPLHNVEALTRPRLLTETEKILRGNAPDWP
tara:strand:+ start:69 stop:815 length:747 start_codon:yes stop_codon:yes gene_type:complete